MSAADAKSILIEAVREEAEHDAVKVARAIERAAREDAQDKARDIIITAIQRFAADHTAEHTVSVVHLPSDEMKGRIIGREGRNIRAFEKATGIDLIIDDTPEAVILSGFDPVRREIARIALNSSSPTAASTPAASRRSSPRPAQRSTRSCARPASRPPTSRRPGSPGRHHQTLGRLKFRTSYGQNVLDHASRRATSRG